MDKPTCETCPYWDKLIAASGDWPAEGNCHRNAPRPFHRESTDDDPDGEEDYRNDRWPCVPGHGFCGEHPGFPAWIESQRKPTPPRPDASSKLT